MNNPLISIIVPVFNTEKYLDRCIKSILNQSYSNLELILIDDGSSDNSLSICKLYQKNDSRIKVFHKNNAGAASARNIGLNNANGEYLGFVDSDDYIDVSFYQKLLEKCISTNSDISYCGRYDVYDNVIKKGLCPSAEELISSTEAINRLFTWDGIDSSQCDKLFKKIIWDGIRYPEGRVCEDVAILYKLLLKANKVTSLPKPLYFYCHRENSASDYSFSEHTFDFEYQTSIILGDILKHNHKEIYDNALYFRMSSIIHTISYIEKIKREDYRKYKLKFNSYRQEIKKYYLNKKKPQIIKRYLHKTLRIRRYYLLTINYFYIILKKIGIVRLYHCFGRKNV